jgi:hypothetical protein
LAATLTADCIQSYDSMIVSKALDIDEIELIMCRSTVELQQSRFISFDTNSHILLY